ncbi:MAG: branched-chain amino acid aminotransferase [Gammaproteobacteria bacterium]|nr:branched-chain amino acid aminotransferase [Gammaproteobacteria bacterium]NIR84110.1 branched-chain amino acid aminotransferase [Gammaproteobacteria bacterium]NIR89408.1 branched-chain amino acid aminotransferase [Gammaproteobacteria bacterium]NIU07129.1 branched-chain amino acid aminotransferase [Gammaproteobacteria bacterium]NIV74633.1 branched-chain amino acid aminotransferase [Gammaproteobacteria bacterium]
MSTAQQFDPAAVPFGTVFAPRMAVAWYADGAWSSPEMRDTGALELHPGAHVLHYASTCFEGLKAFRWRDGNVHTFRLDRHVARMQKSAELLCLPVPEASTLERMVVELAAECAGEIPELPGALYLRPTLIGTEVNIGAAGSATAEACLYVLASPVGDYFRGGLRPLRVLIEDQHPRTTPEFGMAKTGGNYAAALRHVIRARADHDADTVLFCPGGDVQETGASNFLLLNDTEVLTKALDPSFLHGVTRDSILTLARDLGYAVAERDFTVDELLEWSRTGEAALSGTAAVLAGVGTFVHRDHLHVVGSGNVGRNTLRLRKALTDVQSGRTPDPYGWLRRVE